MAKRGQPTKFNCTIARRIIELIQEGKTDPQIASAIGVSVRSLKYWKAGKPDFLHAVQEAKSIADDLVEAALFNRATGYSHRAVKMFYNKDTGEIVTQKYIQHHPPDTGAATFWLKNRQPKRWREKTDVVFPDKNGNPQAIAPSRFDGMTEDQLKAEAAALEMKLKALEK